MERQFIASLRLDSVRHASCHRSGCRDVIVGPKIHRPYQRTATNHSLNHPFHQFARLHVAFKFMTLSTGPCLQDRDSPAALRCRNDCDHLYAPQTRRPADHEWAGVEGHAAAGFVLVLDRVSALAPARGPVKSHSWVFDTDFGFVGNRDAEKKPEDNLPYLMTWGYPMAWDLSLYTPRHSSADRQRMHFAYMVLHDCSADIKAGIGIHTGGLGDRDLENRAMVAADGTLVGSLELQR